MFASIPIGHFLGVKIRVHLLFLVLVAVFVFTDWAPWQFSMADRALLLGILWGSVFLHEMGHSLMARRLGVQVLDITFWPLGGMARFTNFPTDPKIELPIAIAGPAVNFIAAAALLPLTGGGEEAYWAKMAWGINLALGVFNLVPAFPMDGGRVLRALLAFWLPFLHATELAVRVGRWIAFGLFLAPFFGLTPWVMYFVMAAFIWISATQELWSTRLRHASATGSPFVFFKSFSFGGHGAARRKEPEAPKGTTRVLPPEPGDANPEKKAKDLESFRGSLREYFDERKDPDGS